MGEQRNEESFVEFAPGATICDGRVVLDAMYVIESGIVAVQLHAAASYVVGPGEAFGESVLLDPAPQVRAEARSHVRALRIPAAAVPGVLQARPDVAMQLLRQATRRLYGVPASASAATLIDVDIDTPPPAPAPIDVYPALDSEAPTGRYVLHHAEGRFELPQRGEWLVGRPDPATGAVPEVNLGPLDLARSLSRRHARLALDGDGGITVREEPGVSNGTWINGVRLASGQTATLQRGDKLRFGAIELELVRQ